MNRRVARARARADARMRAAAAAPDLLAWVALAPEVDEHKSKRGAKEEDVAPGRDGHERRHAKEQAPDKVGGAAAKAALLQRAAVADDKEHVEEEVDAEVSKEEEVGEQPPDLARRNRARAVVQVVRAQHVQRAERRRHKGTRKVAARHDRQLIVPIQQIKLHRGTRHTAAAAAAARGAAMHTRLAAGRELRLLHVTRVFFFFLFSALQQVFGFRR